MTIGEVLRRERVRAGLSQVELARILGVSQVQIWRFEGDMRPIPHELVARLPDGVRQPVAAAAIAELERQAWALHQML